MSMISIDTGPKWLDTRKYQPDAPGNYWGIVVVIDSTIQIFRWNGDEWNSEFGPPFYFWPECLPQPDTPSDAILDDIKRQVKRYTGR